MIKKITCIQCPKGCALSVDIENCRVVKVTGNECPKGEKYAVSEIENPMRVLTSAVLTEGLSLKMAPVRTDGPIPKPDTMRAMDEIKKLRLKKPAVAGETLVKDFMGLGVNLIITRQVS